jgi:L-rhamnose isomerase
MRLSEFWALMEQEFGSGYAGVVARTQSLGSIGGRTVHEAMDEGLPVRQIWEALVKDMDVPPQHHWLADPKERRG